MGPSDAVERFLATGEVDPHLPGWQGDVVRRRRTANAELRSILCRVVLFRAARAPIRPPESPENVAERVRARITPLVTGLFRPPLRAALLAALPERVRVLTLSQFAFAADSVPLRDAWGLANLLLDDLGAPPLADDTPELDGLCAGGRAWVLPRAFDRPTPLPDVLTHEVAHLLHLLRRDELGLGPSSRPLLAVLPRRRETFAYACELWSALGRDGARDALRGEVHAASGVPDARVDRRALDALLDGAAAHPRRAWALIRGWATGRLPLPRIAHAR